MKLDGMWKNKDKTEWYLEPENENEAAILVKLCELFPKYFEMFTSKSCISYRYEARLKIKEFNLAEHIPPNMNIMIKDDISFGTYYDPTELDGQLEEREMTEDLPSFYIDKAYINELLIEVDIIERIKQWWANSPLKLLLDEVFEIGRNDK